MFHYMVILHVPVFMWFTACPFGQFLAPHVEMFFELWLTIRVFENQLCGCGVCGVGVCWCGVCGCGVCGCGVCVVCVCVCVDRKKTFLTFCLNMSNKNRILTAAHSHATCEQRLTAYWKIGEHCAPCVCTRLSEEWCDLHLVGISSVHFGGFV